MKTHILLLYLIIASVNTSMFAQNITNNGATITINDGTKVTLTNSGNFTNSAGGVLSISGTSGEIVIPGNFVNTSGTIDLNGIITLSGNFTNDAANNVFQNVGTDGTVIFAGADQYISNSVADAYIDFENIQINNGSNTYLNAGSAATINGILNVLSGGEFRLLSPADGEGPSGSLITNTGDAGNVTGAGALFIDRHYETAGRYQYISFPVNNAEDDDFDNTNLTNNFNPNLYIYNESYDAPGTPPNTDYSNWTDPTYALYDAWKQISEDGNTVTLSGNAVGYVTYNERELDVSLGGSPSNLNNLSSYSPSVTFTANDGNANYYDGWNIVGNPYPVALDWDDINWTKSGISNTLYMWDGDAGNYIYYNDGTPNDVESSLGSGINYDLDARYIPPMQAFSVKASGSPTFVIPQEARIHYNKNMYKKSEKSYAFDYLKLRTEINGYSDEMIVRFIGDATVSVDDQYDAYKMFPNNQEIPMIYSLVLDPETPVAINTLPISSEGTTIPLGFKTNSPGSFSITAKEYHFDIGTEVKLIDTYLETETILDQAVEYSFNFSGEEIRDRFYLFVGPKGASDIEENKLNSKINIWSASDNVYITISSNDLIDAEVQIFDVLGKAVIHKNLYGTYNIINVPSSGGTYFVKLKTKDGEAYFNKVFVQK